MIYIRLIPGLQLVRTNSLTLGPDPGLQLVTTNSPTLDLELER